MVENEILNWLNGRDLSEKVFKLVGNSEIVINIQIMTFMVLEETLTQMKMGFWYRNFLVYFPKLY